MKIRSPERSSLLEGDRTLPVTTGSKRRVLFMSVWYGVPKFSSRDLKNTRSKTNKVLRVRLYYKGSLGFSTKVLYV